MIRRFQTELVLTFFAVALLAVGYVASAANALTVTDISLDELRTALVLGAFLIAVPLIWGVARMRSDAIIYPVAAMLLAIGAVSMRRLQIDIGGPESSLGNLSGRHMMYVVVSVVLLGAVGRWFPFWGFLRRYKYLTVGSSIALLMVTLVAGRERYGA